MFVPEEQEGDPEENRTRSLPSGAPMPAPPEDATIVAETTPKGLGWIAGYRILRKLGEGGMGVVYEAEQQEPRRRVALKVIRGAAALDEHMVRLFHREVQTLALLKHPGIAAIYDAGHTEEGQHFFAMELVAGVPLDEFLKANPVSAGHARRDLRLRLQLFLKICDAIHYAHQRGVIHRDIKPSNIHVVSLGSEAEHREISVKILDFGLARITDVEAPAPTIMTEVGQIQGTLAYMSPEQAKGLADEIDLRTDVYSLGVVLYQLLTDRLPYSVSRSAIHEAVRVICEEAPGKPSLVLRVLRGDLETIVLRSLEKEPRRRYQSALAFGDDVERYLTDLPILARPPSAGYQLRKMMARHKGPFAFAGVLLILLAGFAVTMSAMFEVQRRMRLRAELETEKAEQINDFLQEMLSSVSPDRARGREVTVREVLDESSKRVEVGLKDQPEVRAAIHSTIGNTYRALGLYEESEPHLVEALGINRRAQGDSSSTIASNLGDLGSLRWEEGDYDAAEPLFRRSLEMNRILHGDRDPSVATSLNNLGLLSKSRGRYVEAESLYRASLTLRRDLLHPDDPEIALSLSNLASLLQATGRFAEAESLHRECVEIRRRILPADHPDIAVAMNNLATTLIAEEKYSAAEPILLEAIAIGRKVYGEDHQFVPSTLNNLGLTYMRLGRLAEAEPIYRDALDRYRAILGEDHPAYFSTLNNLANLLQSRGDLKGAERLYRRNLDLRRKLLGEEHPEVAMSLQNLAIVLQEEGKLNESEALFREALRMRRKLLGGDHPRVASSLVGLALVLVDRGDRSEAETVLRESLAILRGKGGDGSWLAAYAENTLGHVLALEGDASGAESLLIGGAEELLHSSGAPRSRREEALRRVVEFYERRGDAPAAHRYEEMRRGLGTSSMQN